MRCGRQKASPGYAGYLPLYARDDIGCTEEPPKPWPQLATAGAVVLLHPPLHSVGVSIVQARGFQYFNSTGMPQASWITGRPVPSCRRSCDFAVLLRAGLGQGQESLLQQGAPTQLSPAGPVQRAPCPVPRWLTERCCLAWLRGQAPHPNAYCSRSHASLMAILSSAPACKQGKSINP